APRIGKVAQDPACRSTTHAMLDTPHGLKPDGFSLHHGGGTHRSTTGLPRPEDGLGRGLVAVQYQPTRRADLRTYREGLLHARSAATALLDGKGGFHQQHLLTGARCLVGKGGTERCPARI